MNVITFWFDFTGHLRSEGIVGKGAVVTEGSLPELDTINEEDLWIVQYCHQCPEDSAGLEYNGRCKCMCLHFKDEPLLRNRPCRRKTVDGKQKREFINRYNHNKCIENKTKFCKHRTCQFSFVFHSNAEKVVDKGWSFRFFASLKLHHHFPCKE